MSYKEESEKVRSYIQKQGFNFKNDNNERRFNSYMQKNIADDLSNSTSLVVDFMNEQKQVQLRVSIGDKKRLNPHGPGLSALSDEELMTILSFSREYK